MYCIIYLENNDLKISLNIFIAFMHFPLNIFDLNLVEFGDLKISDYAYTLSKITELVEEAYWWERESERVKDHF